MFLSLTCRWLSSHCIFTWSSLICVCVLISSSYKDSSHIGLGPILITSFQLTELFKAPISKYVLRYWGVQTSSYEFWGDTIQPMTKDKSRPMSYETLEESKPDRCKDNVLSSCAILVHMGAKDNIAKKGAISVSTQTSHLHLCIRHRFKSGTRPL